LTGYEEHLMKKPEILIIDDEPINLTILRNLLNDFFAVRACKSGTEALRLINTGSKPDLILLDIMMPGLDGYETLALIRATVISRLSIFQNSTALLMKKRDSRLALWIILPSRFGLASYLSGFGCISS